MLAEIIQKQLPVKTIKYCYVHTHTHIYIQRCKTTVFKPEECFNYIYLKTIFFKKWMLVR